jgi:hypothetical protein
VFAPNVLDLHSSRGTTSTDVLSSGAVLLQDTDRLGRGQVDRLREHGHVACRDTVGGRIPRERGDTDREHVVRLQVPEV